MVQGQPPLVLVEQGIGGASDRLRCRHPEAFGQALGQTGLAGAQVAAKPDYQRLPQQSAQQPPEGPGIGRRVAGCMPAMHGFSDPWNG